MTEQLTNFLCNAYTYSSQVAGTVMSTLNSIIRVNYYAVSFIFDSVVFIGEKLSSFAAGTYFILSVLAGVFADFIIECYNFLLALIILLWKFLLLILSILDVILRLAERTAYFLFSGGVWTAGALKTTFSNCADAFANLYDYFEVLLKYVGTECQSLLTNFGKGISAFGAFSFDALTFCLSTVRWIISSTFYFVDNSMLLFADSVRFIVDSAYFFITDTVTGATKETYYGIMMLVLLYLLIYNAHSALYNRGMTFPFMPFTAVRQPGIHRHHRGNEFSDDEMSQTEEDLEDDVSESGSEDDNESDEESDSNEEYSVVDDSDENNDGFSDDGSDTNSQYSEIDVQLPNENDGRYNLRRSTTPSVNKVSSPEDLDKELEKEREKNLCVVCQDKKKSVLILPCRHMCLCVECAHRVARYQPVTRRTCPLCRQRIKTIMDVFV
ncbi:hypothetical protein FSP39_024091 [Pinctada imbricata]|uniref:RING-type domain-containing protein n=1 Tax=Pinctada imbricata TaxID=66713 RepID=A0AA89BVF6_PINIB|nr:hypothetical protein FSP39_024091 [Pinctada imbricata]